MNDKAIKVKVEKDGSIVIPAELYGTVAVLYPFIFDKMRIIASYNA